MELIDHCKIIKYPSNVGLSIGVVRQNAIKPIQDFYPKLMVRKLFSFRYHKILLILSATIFTCLTGVIIFGSDYSVAERSAEPLNEPSQKQEIPYFDLLERYLAPSFSSGTNTILSESTATKVYRNRYQFGPPSGFLDWIKMATFYNCSLSLEFYDQAIRDVLPFRNLNDTRKNKILSVNPESDHYFNLKFVNGKLSTHLDQPQFGSFLVDEYDFKVLKKSWEITANDWDEPKIIFANGPYEGKSGVDEVLNDCINEVYTDNNLLMHSVDYYKEQGMYAQPGHRLILSQSKGLCYSDVLLPMSYHQKIVVADASWQSDEKPFDEKSPALFWRGTTTGGSFSTGSDWKSHHRILLLEWEKKYREKYPSATFLTGQSFPEALFPVPVDIGLSGTVQCDPETCARISEEYGIRPFVDKRIAMNFKYLLVVDGNSWPSRLQEYLQFQSVILYPRASFDWYIWYLKPFVHYVPVNLDFSDLEEKLEWLHNNPDRARAIIQNANNAMRILNRVEQMKCYSFFTLMHLEEYLA